MAQPNFDYQGALDAGYSESEINDFLQQYKPANQNNFSTSMSKNAPNPFGNAGNLKSSQKQAPQVDQKSLRNNQNFDYQGALDAGYNPDEINEFLSAHEPEKSLLQKGGRLAGQLALGTAERIALPYEIGVTPLRLPGGREAMGDLFTRDVLNEVYPTEEEGKEVGPRELSEPIDIGIRGLTEKATGLDLHPKGVLEKGASWLGFIKNPTHYKEILKLGTKPKELLKAITPTGTEVARGLGAGTALQMAEEGQFGPVGTMAVAIMGDLAGFGPKGLLNIAKNPKKTLAQATNLLTGANNQKEWIKQIVSDANEAGVQLDAGTLTDSNLVRFAQARAAQSALSGKSLDNFRKDLSQQIVQKYQGIISDLGELSFENNYQASEAIRSFVNNEEKNLFNQFGPRESQQGRSLVGRIAQEQQPDYQQELLNRIAPQEFRNSYEAGETLKTVAEDVKAPIKEEFNQRWANLNRQIEVIPAGPQEDLARRLDLFVREHEGSLLLGESTAENRVLQAATRLRNSLMTEDRAFIGVPLNNLIKTKRTLGDVANWEFGGSNFQSAYKGLVGDIDQAIERTLGEVNPGLRTAYEELNAEYSAYKDLFENKSVMPLFEPKNQNYNSLYNSFLSNPDKLRALEDLMWNNPRGQQLINQVKRDYAQRIIENPNMAPRDLRNLENVLGPQYRSAIQEYLAGRQQALDHPMPRAARQPAIGAQVQISELGAKPLTGRGTPKEIHARQKLYEYIKNKDSDQVMKLMDRVEGIRRLKRVLSLTPEGEELFDKLKRYKLYEMIDKNMMDNLNENVKLGTFSGLFKSTKSQSIVKELVGPDTFKQIQLLQKNAGRLAASAEKFYNASKSGTTITDVATVGSLMTGIFTGNPYMALTAGSAVGGIKLAGYLLTDKKFLKYLEQAALTDNKKKFFEILKSMQSSVDGAIIKTSMDETKER